MPIDAQSKMFVVSSVSTTVTVVIDFTFVIILRQGCMVQSLAHNKS